MMMVYYPYCVTVSFLLFLFALLLVSHCVEFVSGFGQYYPLLHHYTIHVTGSSRTVSSTLTPITPITTITTASSSATTTQLEAKATKKKKPKKKNGRAAAVASSGGGFGGTNTKKNKEHDDDNDNNNDNNNNIDDNDYAVFPALAPQVQQSLIPATPWMREEPAGELDEEMYHRLADIYGFGWFNYLPGEDPSTAASSGSESTTSTESTTFQELLSGGGDTMEITGSSSTDFSDLLAGTTGKGTATSTSTSTISTMEQKSNRTTTSGTQLDLATLPPFHKFRVLHVDPLVLSIDDFFTHDECDRYIRLAVESSSDHNDTTDTTTTETVRVQSKTVGTSARDRAQRTSTTWFHHYHAVPELLAKASRLLGLTEIHRWEEPQVVRYRKGERFTWHLDALPPPDAATTGDQRARWGGGQRIATLLVYLTELTPAQGGATMFRDLGRAAKTESSGGTSGGGPLKVAPCKGSALLFFPAAGGVPHVPFDIRTLHCGEPVDVESSTDKWISQLWLRETPYQPTAPPHNNHDEAAEAINHYCRRQTS